jgi:hypothetical protein
MIVAQAACEAWLPGETTGIYSDGHESPRARNTIGCGLWRDRCVDDAVRRTSRPNDRHAVAGFFQLLCDRLSERLRRTSHAPCSRRCPGRLGRNPNGQRLQRGFCLQTQDHFASRIEPGHPFIPPQDASGLGDEPLIDGRGLPITTPMGLQAGGGQEPSDGRIVHRVHHGLLHDYLLQAPAIQARHLQPIDARVSACDTLHLHAAAREKTGGRPLRSPSKMASTPHGW